MVSLDHLKNIWTPVEKPKVDIIDNLSKDLWLQDKSVLLWVDNKVVIELNQKLKNNNELLNKFKYLISNNKWNLDSNTFLKIYNKILVEENNAKKVELDAKKIKLDAKKEEEHTKNENFIKAIEVINNLVSKLNLTQNPKYNSWQEEAKQKILSQKPELAKNPTDLNSLVNSYILISHQNELAAWDESIKKEISWLNSLINKSDYEDVFKWIAIDEAFKDKPWITNFDTQKAKASLIPDWNDVKIEWNKIESFSWKTEEAKQIIELDKANSPKKFIEKNGYRLETTQYFLSDTDYEIQKEKFNKDYETQKANNDELKIFFTDFPNDYLTQNWISTLTTKLNTSQNLDKSGELRDLLKEFNQNSQELQSLKQDDPLAEYKRETIIDSQKSLKGLIDQKLKAISEQYFATNKSLSKIDSELKSLEKKENSRITNFRELQSQKDLEAEKTIDFLNNLWLTNIPQADLEYIFKQLNITQNLDPQLDINNWLAWTIWNPKQTKEYIFNTFSKIYTKLWYTNLDKQKIMDWQDATLKNPDFKAKMKEAFKTENAIDGKLNIDKILNILKSNPENNKQENIQNKSKNSTLGARIPKLA